MADTKVSAETAATALDGTELTRIVQGGSSKKTTLAVAGHQLRGAKVRLTSDDTTVNTTGGHDVSWDAATYDTDAFWSAGSPTRLTIPAGLGITHIDIEAHVRINLSTADSSLNTLIKHLNSSGTVKEQIGLSAEKGTVTVYHHACAVGIAVDDGDYFTFTLTEETDNSVTIVSGFNQTCMTIVVRGMEPV